MTVYVPKTATGWTSMSIARNIIYFAVSKGASLQALLAAAGISETDLNDPKMALDLEASHQLWSAALRETKEPHLGLLLGEQSNPAVLGIVGHLYQSCPNLLEGMLNLQRFNDLFGSLVKIKVMEEENRIGLCFVISVDRQNRLNSTARQAIDAWMSAVVSIFSKVGAGSPRPVEIHLSRLENTSASAYETIFAPCQITHNQADDIIWYPKSAMLMPLITYNPDMYAYFLRLAQEQLETLYGQKNCARTIQALLTKNYKNGFPSIEQLAGELNTTARTLQRKLKAEGYTFSQLIEQVKQDMAFQLLRTRKYNISEVAYMLGFSEPGSFTRTFRKWTGKSPRQFYTL